MSEQFICRLRQVPCTIEGVDSKPDRVWSLAGSNSGITSVTIPVAPLTHGKGAFIEDYVHDWNYDPVTKRLRFYSRVAAAGDFVLLEWGPPPAAKAKFCGDCGKPMEGHEAHG